ncbi:helix-turn-helix domain-containing protein [Actinoallomurus rhizosphaericola]|uniref:helix-turn-helix domain-containing protein n=1 Tax=Actinoallomurus rhizosphaericola TaxID=2952536 RepID=UPI002092ECE5|nr:helix-turn-helix domain-containing protein [Actinoallomurus rhizosphaericola]MCO5999762.1 helix-turn-helix domain-containing protein [Actinoallomurus rhizosphaericola]
MFRTIRIDDEVMACLEQHARPGDTPNQMVRRFLGMEDTPSKPDAACAVQAALRANPGLTAAELAHAAGVGYSTAGKALAALADKGAATRTTIYRTEGGGPGRTGYRWWPADYDHTSQPRGD